jgi:hypothetical protein
MIIIIIAHSFADIITVYLKTSPFSSSTSAQSDKAPNRSDHFAVFPLALGLPFSTSIFISLPFVVMVSK